MSNYIYFFASRLFHYLKNALSDIFRIVDDRSKGFLIPIMHRGAISFQLLGNTPPVIKVPQIPKSDPMDKKKRISGPAELRIHAQFPKSRLLPLMIVFLTD